MLPQRRMLRNPSVHVVKAAEAIPLAHARDPRNAENLDPALPIYDVRPLSMYV